MSGPSGNRASQNGRTEVEVHLNKEFLQKEWKENQDGKYAPLYPNPSSTHTFDVFGGCPVMVPKTSEAKTTVLKVVATLNGLGGKELKAANGNAQVARVLLSRRLGMGTFIATDDLLFNNPYSKAGWNVSSRGSSDVLAIGGTALVPGKRARLALPDPSKLPLNPKDRREGAVYPVVEPYNPGDFMDDILAVVHGILSYSNYAKFVGTHKPAETFQEFVKSTKGELSPMVWAAHSLMNGALFNGLMFLDQLLRSGVVRFNMNPDFPVLTGDAGASDDERLAMMAHLMGLIPRTTEKTLSTEAKGLLGSVKDNEKRRMEFLKFSALKRIFHEAKNRETEFGTHEEDGVVRSNARSASDPKNDLLGTTLTTQLNNQKVMFSAIAQEYENHASTTLGVITQVSNTLPSDPNALTKVRVVQTH